MPMIGTDLKALTQVTIYNQLKADFTPSLPDGLSPASQASIDQSWQKIADSVSQAMVDIVSYIQSNAVVASTVAVASVSGVTTGLGVSGPGAGTATGTVS